MVRRIGGAGARERTVGGRRVFAGLSFPHCGRAGASRGTAAAGRAGNGTRTRARHRDGQRRGARGARGLSRRARKPGEGAAIDRTGHSLHAEVQGRADPGGERAAVPRAGASHPGSGRASERRDRRSEFYPRILSRSGDPALSAGCSPGPAAGSSMRPARPEPHSGGTPHPARAGYPPHTRSDRREAVCQPYDRQDARRFHPLETRGQQPSRTPSLHSGLLPTRSSQTVRNTKEASSAAQHNPGGRQSFLESSSVRIDP